MQTPTPLQYAHGNFPTRWSPWPVTIACTFLGLLITASSALVCNFIPMFRDFKVEVPLVAKVVIWLAQIIWLNYLWVILLPMLIAVPAFVIPHLPVPAQPESRVRIVRTTRYILILLLFTIVAVVVLCLLAPMIALIQGVSGPQKN